MTPDDRCVHLAAVVLHREWKRELLGAALPMASRCVACLTERAPAAFGQRLAAEARERLRRAEARRGAADEQDARQARTRHGSL